MIDPPRRAMRPIYPDTVANFAAEQRVAGNLELLGLGVEQRVLDGTQPLADDAAGGRPSEAIELSINPLVVEDRLSDDPPGEPLDNGADPRRTKALVELAPADNALIGRQFEEMVNFASRHRSGEFPAPRPSSAISRNRRSAWRIADPGHGRTSRSRSRPVDWGPLLGERFGDEDAGVVDERVDPPEPGHPFGDRTLGRLPIGDVAGHSE